MSRRTRCAPRSTSTARPPLRLARAFLPAMVERRRGGFIIMSSIAGQQGSPGITTYAATKAFGAVLAEGLWAEMRPHGVDVLACAPGAVQTPGWPRSKSKRAPGTVAPDVVAAAALDALGHRPRTVPGGLMKFAAAVTAASAAPTDSHFADRQGVRRPVLGPNHPRRTRGTSRTSTPHRRATHGTRPPWTITENSTTTKMIA